MSELFNILIVGILLGGIYSLVSIGLNLIFGVIRVVNFAQGEFVMLGMYATYAAFSFLHMDPYLAIVIVFPSLFGLGILVQRFIVQPLQGEPMMQVFATFGMPFLHPLIRVECVLDFADFARGAFDSFSFKNGGDLVF